MKAKTATSRLEVATLRLAAAIRYPHISAPGKTGTELGSYTEIVDFMRTYSPNPTDDFRELYRHLIITILVSNNDDHLKNHGFLYVGAESLSRTKNSP